MERKKFKSEFVCVPTFSFSWNLCRFKSFSSQINEFIESTKSPEIKNDPFLVQLSVEGLSEGLLRDFDPRFRHFVDETLDEANDNRS